MFLLAHSHHAERKMYQVCVIGFCWGRAIATLGAGTGKIWFHQIYWWTSIDTLLLTKVYTLFSLLWFSPDAIFEFQDPWLSSFLVFPCVWWPWQCQGLLSRHLVEFPSVGKCLKLSHDEMEVLDFERKTLKMRKRHSHHKKLGPILSTLLHCGLEHLDKSNTC